MKIKSYIFNIININIIILTLSLFILLFSCFNKNGIVNKIKYYNINKKIIYTELKNKEKEIYYLSEKLKLLKSKNKEVLEIIDFHYKKKIPYEKYEIIN